LVKCQSPKANGSRIKMSKAGSPQKMEKLNWGGHFVAKAKNLSQFKLMETK